MLVKFKEKDCNNIQFRGHFFHSIHIEMSQDLFDFLLDHVR